MSIYGSITSETLANVGASWIQSSKDKFAWTKLPMCRVLGQGNGHGSTVYSLPALDNFLEKAGGLSDWAYGAARRAPRDLSSASVTVTPLVQDIQPITRPMTSNANTEQVHSDLKGNILPGQLSMVYQGIERRLATLLTDGTLGTSVAFTGTGVLDTYMTNTDHDPIGDILAGIESNGLHWKAEADGTELVMFISPRVLYLLQRHPAFTGSGAASGVAQVTHPQDVYDQLMMKIPHVQKVVTLNAAADTVRAGQTSAPALIGRNVLAFQLCDPNMSRNLASNPFDTPKGSVCYFEAEAPNVSVAEDADTKSVKFNGDVEYQIGTPRGATHGIYFAGSEMFTP